MARRPPNILKNKNAKIVRSRSVAGAKNKTNKSRREDKKKDQLLGKDVTIREAATDWQIVYGEMKIGGAVTFVETNQNTHAYILIGTSNSQMGAIARTAGTAGNSVTLRIILSGTNPTLTCGVVGNDITITLKSTSGTSESTAQQVINIIRATPAADALVDVNRGDGDGTGLMAAFAQTALSGGGGNWLSQYITLTGHEIQSVEGLYLDNQLVTFDAGGRWGSGIWTDRVFMAIQYGSDSQEVQGDLKGQHPSKWTDTHRQRGCAGVYLILVWNDKTFAEGLPEITFLVKGKKIYDPRGLSTAYSQNSALCVADFLTNTRYGLGIDYADIDEDALEAAANICDQSLTMPNGTWERYKTNGIFNTSQQKGEILDQLLAAMGGDIVVQGGKYYIYAAAYRSPSITLTEDDLRDEISIRSHVAPDSSFNCIRGTYIDYQADFLEQDIPPIKNSTYIAEDGGQEIYEDIALHFVTQVGQAQRLLKIELERVRQGIEVDFPAKLTALNIKAGDTVNVTLSQFGWSAKVFEVRETAFSLGLIPGIDLLLRETASGVFDWSSGEETTVDLAPDTDLPTVTDVEEPQNVTLTSGTSELDTRADGTILTRLKVSWDATTKEFVYFGGTFEIQFKKSASSDWSQSFTVPGYVTFHHLVDVKDGVNYDVRIRAKNTVGYYSDWVQVSAHTVIGKTAAPSNVSGFAYVVTDDGIKLSWTAITDLDRSEYEIRSGASWGAGAVVARIKASDATAFTYQYRTASTLTLRIKAIDTSGNYSTTDSSVTVTLTGPSDITSLTAKVIDAAVLLDWANGIAGTFSVNKYYVYKGTSFASAVLIGTVFGTFHTYIETQTGTFTYWVVAEDVGGNTSSEVSVTVAVSVPDSFYAVEEVDMLEHVSLVEYCTVLDETVGPNNSSGKTVFFPMAADTGGATGLWFMLMTGFDSEQTWEEWFDANGWLDWQDAIDAGFDGAYPTPGTLSPGQIQCEHDFGSLLPGAYIAADRSLTNLSLVEPYISREYSISVSEDGSTWTEYSGLQAFVSAFRYLRFKMSFDAWSTLSLASDYNYILNISLSRTEELGRVQALAADEPSGGTVVTFTSDFYDVEDIQLTAEGTIAAYAVLNFTDTPNPTSFKVLLYDENGTALTGYVRYRIRGAINVS